MPGVHSKPLSEAKKTMNSCILGTDTIPRCPFGNSGVVFSYMDLDA